MILKQKSKRILKLKYPLITPFLIGILVFNSCQKGKEFENNLPSFPEEIQEGSKAVDEFSDWKKTSYNSGDVPECIISKPVHDCINYKSVFGKNNLDNYLKIKLGTTMDAVVKLISMADEKCVRTVYVKANEEIYLKNIPAAKHYLKIAYGMDWREQTTDGKCIGKFAKNPQFQKRSDALDFSVITLPNGLDVPSFELTLDVSYNFGAISEKEFHN